MCCWRTFPAPARPRWPRRWRGRSLPSSRRVQFTPDLLPSDILGVSIFDQTTSDFRVPRGTGLHEHPVGRRDQPRLAAHAVGAARGDGGGPGQRGRGAARVAGVVFCDRHAEPGRVPRHLSAARGADGPVCDAIGPGLSDAGGGNGDARGAGAGASARADDGLRDAGGCARLAPGGAGGAGQPRRCDATWSTWCGDPQDGRRALGREPAPRWR